MADRAELLQRPPWGRYVRWVDRRIPRPFVPVMSRIVWDGLTFPATVVFLLANPRIHPAYGLTWGRRLRLAWRMYTNTFRVFAFTSFKAHLAMATKLLELPPDDEGVVVECGCFLGGSAANLSLVCDIVGRQLILYDSFEGLPAPDDSEGFGRESDEGGLRGGIEQVRRTIARLGAIDRCTFRKGWFKDTLPDHDEPIVLCFLDGDYESSLYECVVHLWPHLTPRGYMFIDEYVLPNHCALFFSETFWSTHFDRPPPGLIGAGTGVPIGNYYLGPLFETPRQQVPSTVAWTRKDQIAHWTYQPPS